MALEELTCRSCREMGVAYKVATTGHVYGCPVCLRMWVVDETHRYLDPPANQPTPQPIQYRPGVRY